MGFLNRQSREDRRTLRENRDAVRELDQAAQEREDRREVPIQQGTNIYVDGQEVRPGEPLDRAPRVFKLPGTPGSQVSTAPQTQQVSVGQTSVESGPSALDRRLAQLPTKRSMSGPDHGPSL